jgi:hypothetical protein
MKQRIKVFINELINDLVELIKEEYSEILEDKHNE